MDGLCSRCNDLSAFFENKNRALRVATTFGHGDCVKACIQAGADVNIQDDDGNTPLMHATSNRSEMCLDLLIKAGADVNAQNKDDDTALILATRKGSVDCVQLLIDSGADVNKQCKRGNTALMEAVLHDLRDCVQLLIQAGADVNKQDKYRKTSLMLSALEGNLECARYLIQAGADVNVVDKDNRTALFSTVAGYNCNVACIKLLLRAGSKINCVDIMKHNALQHYILHYQNVPEHAKSPDKIMFMLLFAAGEGIDGTTVEVRLLHDRLFQVSVPDYLLNKNLKLNLKHLCRETIRQHLINIDPHQHLFYRVPQLGLPDSLVSYLLYNQSIDETITVNPKLQAAVPSRARPAAQVTSRAKRCIIT